MDTFRFALLNKEISLRVYDLTTLVITFNPGNYTAWYVRRKCLDQVPELADKIEEERKYINSIGPSMTKNYQYWHHRILLVKKYGKLPEDEYKHLKDIYDLDDKNYHMWTYRMWITETFNLWETEKEDIVEKIKKNPTNNSAWSYRYFLVFHNADYTKVAEIEVDFAKKAITSNVTNECAWVYYKGVLFVSRKKTVGDMVSALELENKLKAEAREYCEKVLDSDPNNRFATSMLIDLLKDNKKDMEKVLKMCDKLTETDKIRKNYWKWLKDNIQAKAKETDHEENKGKKDNTKDTNSNEDVKK